MATHSSVLAWRIPGTGELGGLPSMGSMGEALRNRKQAQTLDPSWASGSCVTLEGSLSSVPAPRKRNWDVWVSPT